MKTLQHLIQYVLIAFTMGATAQQGINYKAIIKNGSGNIVANQNITVQFQILQGAGMVNVYQETHMPMTDANGIVIVNIGQGTTSDDFTAINWGADNHYLNVQIDTGGGLTDMGTTQFMAVPYAKFAEKANDVELLQAQLNELNERITDLERPYLGQYRDGGIVFWINPEDDLHGLVCAIADQGLMPWWNGEYVTTNVFETSIGSGFSNTEAIIDELGPTETEYAAGIARNYSGGGYNDWFLPSKDELYEMFLKGEIIEAALSAIAFSEPFSVDDHYWSSSEWFHPDYPITGLIWAFYTKFFSMEAYGMEYLAKVRPIRAF